MRVLVVYNFDGCRLGQIGAALDEAGAEIDLVRAHRGEPLPAGPQGHDGIVILGGVQNALADDSSPWLPGLIELMRDFADSGRSLLGVCLGSQLLARAYGGANLIGGASEFGWQPVELTAEGAADLISRFRNADERFRRSRGVRGDPAGHRRRRLRSR